MKYTIQYLSAFATVFHWAMTLPRSEVIGSDEELIFEEAE